MKKNILMKSKKYEFSCLDQGLVKAAKLFFKSLLFWLAGEVSLLALEYSLRVKNKSKDI